MTTSEKLRLLAEKLKTVDDRHFDMSHIWAYDCGCALGHALQIPEFVAEGLKYSKSAFPVRPSTGFDLANWAYSDVAAKFFCIEIDDAIRLFNESSYEDPTRENVIKMLLEVAEGYDVA